MREKRSKRKRPAGLSTVRFPLPKKGQMRHGDAKKFQRPREKARVRREIQIG